MYVFISAFVYLFFHILIKYLFILSFIEIIIMIYVFIVK